MLQIAAAALLAYAGARTLMRFPPALNIAVGLAAVAAMPALLYALGFWRADELAALRHAWVRQRRGTLS
jgi:hypothetical protein